MSLHWLTLSLAGQGLVVLDPDPRGHRWAWGQIAVEPPPEPQHLEPTHLGFGSLDPHQDSASFPTTAASPHWVRVFPALEMPMAPHSMVPLSPHASSRMAETPGIRGSACPGAALGTEMLHLGPWDIRGALSLLPCSAGCC